MTEQVLDAEIVPDGADVPLPEPSAELVRRERKSEVMRPLDPDALISSFRDYQALLQRILTPDDWQGPPNRPGSFVKKKGWRKIATAFDLDVKRVGTCTVERDDSGSPLRAEACYVAIAPSGRSMDGDGYCSADEPRFAAPKGRQKLENDLRATASTRAKNRAISDLVGLGAVSAEEVDVSATSPDPTAGYGEEASPAMIDQASRSIAYLLNSVAAGDDSVPVLLAKIRGEFGYIPRSVTRALGWTAATLKGLSEQTDAPGSGEQSPAHVGSGDVSLPPPGSVPLPELKGNDEQKAPLFAGSGMHLRVSA